MCMVRTAAHFLFRFLIHFCWVLCRGKRGSKSESGPAPDFFFSDDIRAYQGIFGEKIYGKEKPPSGIKRSGCAITRINCKWKGKSREVTEDLHIVRDFYIGNTRIMIADNYCRDKSPEDVQRILQKIARDAQAAFSAAANAADKG